MTSLPGFGKQKSQIFVALLAKQLGVRPEGWESVVGDYSQEGYRSVADVVDVASLEKVRAYKKEKKAAGKAVGRLTCGLSLPARLAGPQWSPHRGTEGSVRDVLRAVVIARATGASQAPSVMTTRGASPQSAHAPA